MRISQALKLGHKSIIGHKRRNFTTIVIISLLFGLLTGIILSLQGTENALLRAADESLGDAYYVATMTNFYNEQICRQEPIPDQPNSFNIICPETTAADSARLVEQYGAEVISQGNSYSPIVAPSQLPQFVTADLAQLPSDALAMLVTPDIVYSAVNSHGDITSAGSTYDFRALPLAQRAEFIRSELPRYIGTTLQVGNYGTNPNWYIAGAIPSGAITHTYDGPGQSPNPFDMMLDFLGMNSSGLACIYLDVDSPAVQAQLDAFQSAHSIGENVTYTLARFTDASAAQRFVTREICSVSDTVNCQRPLLSNSSFDNRISLHESSKIAWGVLDIATTVIIVIVAIIMLFTFIKVLGDQSSQIRLYRSLGASTFDLYLIYGAYLLEVCLYAIGFMFLLGLAISALMSFLNASAFSDILTIAYGQTFSWPKILIGWNSLLIKLVNAMLIVAGLSLLWFIFTKKYRQSSR